MAEKKKANIEENKSKHVKFSDDHTRVLLNKVRAKILNANPELWNVSDEYAIRISLENFLGE